MGMIYKRGNTFWIKYYRNGKPYRETTKSHKEADAKRLLQKREGEIANGKLPGVYFDRMKFDELADDFLTDYRINQRKSIERAEYSVGHLKKHFEEYSVSRIDSPRISAYIESRLDDGAMPATINRELSALKRALNLGARQTPPKVDRVPYIPMLKENNVKKGFFEHGNFIKLRDAIPEYLKGFVTFAYKTGWRLSEIAGLQWSQVDLDIGIVRLEPGETKNDDARTVYLDAELKEMIAQQWENQKGLKTLTPYVFPRNDGKGKIADIRKAWNTACRGFGLGYGYRTDKKYVKKWEDRLQPGPTIHDFRRTAVRNMNRAGVPERVAMMISGHKSRSVFDRYNIVNDEDLKQAAQRQADYLQSQMGTISGTVYDLDKKRANQHVG